MNQGDSPRHISIASARDLDSFPYRGWTEPAWDPTLNLHQWVHLAGVYARDRIQLFINGEIAAQVRAPMKKMRSVGNALLHIGHDARYPPTSRVFFGMIKDVRLLRYPPTAEEVKMVSRGLYTLALRPRIATTPTTAASGQHQDNEGSEEYPVPVSQLSDLTLPDQVFAHGDFCASHARLPNEKWDETSSIDAAAGRYHSCRFEGQTTWIPKRGVASNYRQAAISKSDFGIGSMVTVFADMEAG